MVKAEKKVIKTEAKKADAKASASAAAITVTKAGQFIAVNKDVLGNTVPADKAKKVLINGKPNTQLQRNVLVPTSSSSLVQLEKTAYKYRTIYSNFPDEKKGGKVPDPLVHIGHKFTKIYTYKRDSEGVLSSTKGAYYNNKKGGIIPPPVISQGIVTTFKRLDAGQLVKSIRVATKEEAKKAQTEKAAVATTEK